jgi:hypothetical protein
VLATVDLNTRERREGLLTALASAASVENSQCDLEVYEV